MFSGRMENYEKQAELSKLEVQAQRRSRIVAVTVSAAKPVSAPVPASLPAVVVDLRNPVIT